MKSWLFPLAIAFAVSLGGSLAIRSFAYADGASSVSPIDAGPSEAIITSPALHTGVPDPLDDPGGFYRSAVDAKARDGWPALAVVILFAIARLLRRQVAWLRSGARAAYTAAAITALGALVDWRLGGGTWMTMVAAILGVAALLLDPAKPMPERPISGTSPANGAA